MGKTLVKKSDYLKVKYKFFLNRILIYFVFLSIPLWLDRIIGLNLFSQSVILLLYLIFMGGQWYLLGKELDHRLKIYYRANSSLERVVYRVLLGSIIMLIFFNFVSFLPNEITHTVLWIYFLCFGIFYSWPTRGKIIEETIMAQFGEMKFLDSFERTILILSGLTFLISLPEISLFTNIQALQLEYDPEGYVSSLLWNFMTVLYSPFAHLPLLYNLIWSFHFYFFGLGLYLLCFYSILRYFFSRRLSMLGTFALVSSWSFSRMLNTDFFSAYTSTSSLLWLWALMWSTRSGTYRSGLFTGLVVAYLAMINFNSVVLFPVGIYFTYFYFMNDRTVWYKKQWVKYNLLGGVLTLGILIFEGTGPEVKLLPFHLVMTELGELIYRKAFFVIAPLGVLLSLGIFALKTKTQLSFIQLDKQKFKEIVFGCVSIILVGLTFNHSFSKDFSVIWMLAFFSILPIECVFQSISRLRSKRNMIYAMYILICLLDSQLENRFRIVGKLFMEIESFKYFIEL